MTTKDIRDYFALFWRVRGVDIEAAELGTFCIRIKSWLPLFQRDLARLADLKTCGVRMLVENDWLLGRKSFEF